MRVCSRQGFTLVEVVIALSIFMVGVLAVATLQGTGLRMAAHAKALSQGQSAACAVAERLMNLPVDHEDLSDRNGNGESGLNDVDEEADHHENPRTDERVRLSWNIAENWPHPQVNTVRVIALWAYQGKEHRTNLEFEKSHIF